MSSPRGGPTDPVHDARLRRGILDTHVARPTAAGLVFGFLALIAGVPITQAVQEALAEDESSLAALFEHAPTEENLRQVENDIEQASYAKELVQPRLQLSLSQVGRVGNKRALIGRDGFLFYTPGLAHLAGPSFLDPSVLAERRAMDPALQPDPRPAIFELAGFLKQRGIALVVFPVPDKTALQPKELHGRASVGVPHNLGWPDFTRDLRAHNVTLFDPTPAQLSATQPAHFLEQDTHWTPVWMQEVARELAEVVTRAGNLSPLQTPITYSSVAQKVERVGDLVDMLKLPDEQTYFQPRTVQLAQVQDESGELWASDPGADVLLLGDSFTNVFSEDFMGWGEAAGLGPQLSLALGRPIDVIAQNDSGAFATRKLLAAALSAGEDRLAGKRVVIWEFAARELSVGDWKHVDYPAPEAR
ncbi:MAG TPA: hypothetical protein VFN67_28590 [Polyangiales bacterium]|nr:hypothetical protein [Polyangiales bacterium]